MKTVITLKKKLPDALAGKVGIKLAEEKPTLIEEKKPSSYRSGGVND